MLPDAAGACSTADLRPACPLSPFGAQVIDEAYGLAPLTNVIDTLVALVQARPGDDRCVVMLGYEDQMREMMRSSNPGFARRFNIAEAIMFDDMSNDDLCARTPRPAPRAQRPPPAALLLVAK